jgi:hypothetical protein
MTFLKKLNTIERILSADDSLYIEHWKPTRKQILNKLEDTYNLSVGASEREELMQLPSEQRAQKAIDRIGKTTINEDIEALNKGIEYIHQLLKETGFELKVEKAYLQRDAMSYPKISFSEETKIYAPVQFKDATGHDQIKQAEYIYTATFNVQGALYLK